MDAPGENSASPSHTRPPAPGAAILCQQDLHEALRLDQIGVVYQPLIDLRSGVCVGAEALARWHRADGQTLSPDHFIPAAEQLQCTDLITARVIERVTAELGALLRAPAEVHVAINICPDELRSDSTLALIGRTLAEQHIDPARIWLEVTETRPVQGATARHVLARARDRGHRIAIDDFGIGYANFQSLRTLPCDVLKMDRSLIADLGEDRVAPLILQCLVQLADRIGLQLIAEGVETVVQAETLRQAGVRLGQGWHFSRPLPAAAFIDFLERANLTAGS